MYVRVPPSAPFVKLLCGLCFAVLVTVFTVGPLRAQRPQICGPGAQMTLKCVDACIICDIDGFTGSNDNGGTQDEGDLPDGFCTSVNHNIQWIGFVAGSRELTLDIAVTNCKKAGGFSFGLEAGVYEVLDCDYKRSVAKSNCESNINNNTTGTFTMDALVPGNYYYLVIDGNFADVCNYAVKVTRGTTEIPQVRNSGGLRGPDRVCSGPQTYEYKINAVPGATYYDWTLDGEPYGSEKDLKQTLSFAKDGEYELCVSASNICNGAPPECVKIKVGDFAPRRLSRAGCTGSPVVVEGKTITASGSYPFTFKNKVGCDSTVVYDVVIGDATKVTIDTAVCSGKATVINGTTVTKSGDYSFAFKTKAGCDSLVTYRVTVTDVKRGSENLGLCAGQSRTVNGKVISAAGTYALSLKTKGGCDSIVTYTVSVSDVLRESVDLQLCAGQSRTVNGKVISAAGSYDFPLKTKGGCDSVVTYVVSVSDVLRDSVMLQLCAGQSRTVNGKVISAAGTYAFTLKTKGGCDSIVTYTVSVSDVLRESVMLQLCAGQSRTVNGKVISAAGTYAFTLKTKGGCDSIVTYTVSVSDVLRESVKLQLCAGQSRTVNGQEIAKAGTYDFTQKTKGGCDSIVTYVVSVSEVLRDSVKLGLCAGQSRPVNGKVLSAAGFYDFPLKTKGGCDSVVTYIVTVSDVLRDSIKLGLCAGQSRTFNGQEIAEAGTYDFTLKTKSGCDSVVTYVVSFSDVLRESIDLQLCSGQSRTVNGQEIAKAGTYDFTLKTKGGCDSIVTYTVSVSDVLRESIDLQLCSGQSRTVNGQVISAAGSYDFPSKTEGGCDSIATYTVVVTDTLRGSVDTVLCPGVSATIKGRSISAAGNYQFPAKTAGGCDSLVIYRVTVRAPVVTQRDTTVCVDAVVSFDGRELRDEGTYRAVRTSATGCDSVIELTLKHKSCGFSATAEASPVSCAGGADGVLKAHVLGPTAPYNMTYARDGGAASAPVAMSPDSTPTVVRELPAGLYEVTFTDRFGAGVTVDVRIGTPTAVRAGTRRIADGAYDIRCAGAADGQVRALASGGTPPYRFSWSDGRDGAQREGLGAQTLQVIVADANGCRDTARVTLTAPPRLAVEVQAIDQGCDPVLEPGGVRIMGLAGGRAGYRIRIDGVDVGPLADRYPLDPGRHVVTLSDAVDCRVDTGFTIDALRVPEVASDSIWRIVKGDSATLGVRTVGEIVGYAWDGPTGLSCATCPTPSVAPLDDATYTVTVTNADGCQARTEALVLVLIDRNMFAPTAISPNGDEINDGFTVYVADEGSLIEELRVFDRWGEEMFFATDITPGDTYAGWSGTYRGRDVNAGVYVYWARVRNSDGATELVKGEFTVMR